MRAAELFQFCPRCAAPRERGREPENPFHCRRCSLVYYFNPTVAAAGLITDAASRILFVSRAEEPRAGTLGVPGGFVDFDESAEDGLRREVREEVGLEIEQVRFLASFPNHYFYREVTYPVVDLYFTARAVGPGEARSLDGVERTEWRHAAAVADEELAFPSLRAALAAFRERPAR